jgi:hypothetical protein
VPYVRSGGRNEVIGKMKIFSNSTCQHNQHKINMHVISLVGSALRGKYCHDHDFHPQTSHIFDISRPKSIHIGHSAHLFQWTSQSYSHIMTINVSQTNITTYNLFHAVITVVKFYGYNQCSDILHSYCLTYISETPPHLLV